MYRSYIAEKLKRIIGNEIPEGFGQPFLKIFELTYEGSREEIEAAAYSCSLFLSCLIAKMPTEVLHTFIYSTKERCSRFSFNCNMYETLFSKTVSQDLENIPLLDNEKEIAEYTLTKQEIFEAFDFYTNQ